jgi:tetratricopeptide (TPR) repeat protein
MNKQVSKMAISNLLIKPMKKQLWRATRLSLCIASVVFSANSWSASNSVSSSTFKELTSIQEQIAANQTTEAFNALKTLQGKVEAGSIDEALVLQMLGYTEMGRNNYAPAIDYLKRSLALNMLPENVKYNVGYMVAQLYAALEKFDEALVFAEDWFKTIEAPTPDQAIFMANIFAQTGKYQQAIPYVKQAIATGASSGKEPRESWYQLYIACSFELKDYPQATEALQTAIKAWPQKPEYWEQLASVYVMQGKELKGLASLQLAWKLGILEKESSIRSMVQLSVTHGIPEVGARLLNAALQKNSVPRNETYVDLLANAWIAARESEPAIAAFEELAKITGSGDPHLRIANIYVEQAKWKPAEKALRKALDSKMKEPGKAWLILGIVMTEQTQFEQGLDAFKKARAYAYTEKQAGSWLKYAEDLRRQHSWKTRMQDENS